MGEEGESACRVRSEVVVNQYPVSINSAVGRTLNLFQRPKLAVLIPNTHIRKLPPLRDGQRYCLYRSLVLLWIVLQGTIDECYGNNV